MKKVLLVAFNGEPGCFAHVLLHALDLSKKGYETRIIIEGAATGLIKELDSPGKPFATLYHEVRAQGLIECVCEACCRKTGALGYAGSQGLKTANEMNGHPSLEKYIHEGWEILTF